jgi:two-component system CitB family sensor kinase
LRLRTRITIVQIALITIIVALTGALFMSNLRTTLHEQLGENALNVARTVARIPELVDAMSTPNPSATIQPLVEQIRMATGASFIVVGDIEGIRYSHPFPDRIGQPMVGGDNGPALSEGKEYVSFATGSLGPSIRGKVPIVDDDDRVIGVVSVGFVVPEANKIVMKHLPAVLFVLLAGFAIALPGAWLLAHSIKRATHGLEPAEIGALAQHRNAILGAIREAIIAIDPAGRVVVANDTAREMLPGLEVGKPILEVLPNSRLPEVLQTGEPEFDQRMLVGDVTVVTNRIPVFIDGKVAGVVASFRDQSELDRLARELSDVRRYTESLRAQAHDFANTLQAVSGMLQLSQVDEAVDFIQEVTENQRELVEALPRSIGDPAVAALLLGKWARAEELHCLLAIDPTSLLEGSLPESSLMVRVVGNLVDNALEAVQRRPVGQRQIRVRMADEDGQVSIEVSDSGLGVPEEALGLIFREGYSTKGEGRGIGLALVKRLVDRAGGSIGIRMASEGGALFQVLLPRPKEV